MKLTNTQNMKSKSGMTLLELTVVILVLLSLISILFIGARAWKKGSDRAGCILNIRNTQQAVRGYMNMKDNTVPATTDIFGDAAYLKSPLCPADAAKTLVTSYTFDANKAIATGTAGGASICLDCVVTTVTDHLPDGNLAQW